MRKPLEHFQPFFDDLVWGIYPSAVQHAFAVNGKVSGSVGAIGEIEKIAAVLHGPKGCAFHYRDSARRRHQPFYGLYSSDLTENEIIFGGRDKLRQTIRKVWETAAPDLIMVIPTPVSDILNEDIDSVCRALREEGIPAVSIKSELFSHRDKNYSKNRLKAIAERKAEGDKSLEMDIKGCGFTEALCALVNQVMEPQEKVPLGVNIETIGWGGEGILSLHEMEDFLKTCGVRVITWIPSASVDELKKAPAAQVNIVKRIRWARMMKEKFGTDYVHLDGTGRYMGITGIMTFYRDLAEKLGIAEEMEEAIGRAYRQAREETEKEREFIARHSCAFVSRSVQYAPEEIRHYVEDYGITIKRVCIIMTKSQQISMDITEELAKKLMNRVREGVSMYAPEAEIVLNPADEDLDSVFAGCDVVVGSSDFTLEGHGAPLIPASADTTSLSFESYVRNVRRLAGRIGHRRERRNLILKDMDITRENYPRYENKESLAARSMWETMWLCRKEAGRDR